MLRIPIFQPEVVVMHVRILISGAFVAIAAGWSAFAQDWTSIKDASVVRSIMTERTLLVYKSTQQYHRRDGNMVEYYRGNQSYIVRKWKMLEDGSICWMIFSKPDHVIDCAVIQRGPGQKLRYKLENTQGTAPIEELDTNPTPLIMELESKAGIAE